MHSGHINFNSIIKIYTAIQQHNNAPLSDLFATCFVYCNDKHAFLKQLF